MSSTNLRPMGKYETAHRYSTDEYSSETTLSNEAYGKGYQDDDAGDDEFDDSPNSRLNIPWLRPRNTNRRRLYQWAAGVMLIVALVVIVVAVWHHHAPAPAPLGSERKPAFFTDPSEKPKIHGGGPTALHGDREQACTTWSEDWEAEWRKSMEDNMEPRIPSARYHGNSPGLVPHGVKVVIMIFYGRREFVDVLDCYLQRNLKVNGGLVDEVHFLSNYKQDEDGEYIRGLLEHSPQYKLMNGTGECSKGGVWGCFWDTATDPNTIYIKIDDDVVYMHEDAIPRLVRSRLAHKEPFAIGANTVNSRLAYVHWHGNTVLPYLPEPADSLKEGRNVTWRASELPLYPKKAYYFDVKNLTMVKNMMTPFYGHRWLPLKQGNNPLPDILLTPIHEVEEGWIGFANRNWAIAAQQLYSLLDNIENERLSRYHIGSEDGMWTPQFERQNIHAMAMWGSDVSLMLPLEENDEKAITVTKAKELGRQYIIDSHAIVGHFSFQYQNAEMTRTDLLDRFRAFANEMVCPADRKKRPLGERCEGF